MNKFNLAADRDETQLILKFKQFGKQVRKSPHLQDHNCIFCGRYLGIRKVTECPHCKKLLNKGVGIK